MPSSTSSSELSWPRSRRPTAIVLAVGFVLLVELVLHLLPARSFYGYGRGLNAYFEVHNYVDDFGAAEVAIVGTSHGREAFVVPELRALCEEKLNRPVTVGNYSCADAGADVIDGMVQHLLASQTPPSLLIYMISPHVLQGDQLNWQRLQIFRDAPVWEAQDDEQTLRRITYALSWRVRDWLNGHLLLFRHRYRFQQMCTDFVRRRSYPSPIKGEMTEWQVYNRTRNIRDWDIGEAALQRAIDLLKDDEGQFRLSQLQCEAFRQTIRACGGAGIPVLVVEAPMPDVVARRFPQELQLAVRGLVETLESEADVAYLDRASLGVVLDDLDFREISHLNYLGASKLTAAIAQDVIRWLDGKEGLAGRQVGAGEG
jgi:hypothetical protein